MHTNPYIHTAEIHNKQAANEILPFIIELIQPKSILDVGCGTGTWLAVAKEFGVLDICGLDTPFVESDQMQIEENSFISMDLSAPFNLGRKFDLIICSEVAEHLPESSAIDLISSITQHGEIVLFSAAIPGQGGQNHINEQWVEYWAELFKLKGFDAYDLLRKKFWNNPKIDWWYRQNLILFAKSMHPRLETIMPEENPISLIHPILFNKIRNRGKNPKPLGIVDSISSLTKAILRRLKLNMV